MIAKLAHQTQKTAGIPNGMRTATVTAVTAGAVTISVSGGTFSSGVGVVTSYAPQVGDVVAVFRQDSSWLILGPTSAVNPWHAMADLGYQNNWTDRAPGVDPIGQYRITADEVKLTGQLVNLAGIPTGNIVTGLPPATAETVMVGMMTGVAVRLTIDATGTLKIFNATASGVLQFTCAYPADSRLS